MSYTNGNSAVLENQESATPANGPLPAVTRVSIVIPVFNESEGVSLLFESLAKLETGLQEACEFEFVLVDDGSQDSTAELLEAAAEPHMNYRVIRHGANRGIAAAIYTGLLNSSHEIVVSIDADGSYDSFLIEKMLPHFDGHIDLLTASPYHPQGSVENVPAWRLLLSQCASKLYRIAMRKKLYCYTSCFRLYRRSRFLDMPPEFNGFIGVAELIWKADSRGLGIAEFPATLRTRQVGKSKMKIARSTLQHLHLMSRITVDRIAQRRRSVSK